MAEEKKLMKKMIIRFVAAFIVLGLLLFLPAGTLDFWEGWLYIAILLFPVLFVVAYFLKHDRELLERRMMMKEKEQKQSIIVIVSGFLFFLGFLIIGLDRRFGWSDVPTALVLIADVITVIGYAIVFFVFKENSYASRIVQVEKGQKVISTGPYAYVRHPMYSGALLMYLCTPISLGSFIAIPFFLVILLFILMRIHNEEELLARELEGYKEYIQKTKYRLIPHIW